MNTHSSIVRSDNFSVGFLWLTLLARNRRVVGSNTSSLQSQTSQKTLEFESRPWKVFTESPFLFFLVVMGLLVLARRGKRYLDGSVTRLGDF